MNYQYVKGQPMTLREIGKDEKWLQDQIIKDPELLGLGNVNVIHKERSQPTGGRIDLILADFEEKVRYEVEIMLGAVDESHIIRTVEYWDVERRRYPSFEHRAVIVAEEITNRFFNVIGLLNKAVPITALQLSAFVFDDRFTLNFVKVLDILEEGDDDGEQVDRKYWEGRGSKKSIELVDLIISLIPKEAGDVRIKYNRHHIALGTTGNNFCWLHPRKGTHIHFHIKVGSDLRDKYIQELEEKGIESGRDRTNAMKIVVTRKEMDENYDLIKKIIAAAEERSRK